jgi:hypothetical protein
MDETPEIGLAIAVAVFTPAVPAAAYFFLMGLLSGAPADSFVSVAMDMLLMSLIVSATHLIVLGLPTVLLLRKLGIFHWWSLVISGFIIGCIPMALFSWPAYSKDSSYVENGVATVVDGVLTSAGWLSYIQGVGITGGLGALTGLTFWLAWTRSKRAIDADAMQRRSS